MAGRENLKRFVAEWLAAFPDSRTTVEDVTTLPAEEQAASQATLSPTGYVCA